MSWRVELTQTARKQMKRLDTPIRAKLIVALERLADELTHQGPRLSKTKKLQRRDTGVKFIAAATESAAPSGYNESA